MIKFINIKKFTIKYNNNKKTIIIIIIINILARTFLGFMFYYFVIYFVYEDFKYAFIYAVGVQ